MEDTIKKKAQPVWIAPLCIEPTCPALMQNKIPEKISDIPQKVFQGCRPDSVRSSGRPVAAPGRNMLFPSGPTVSA
jgi:hypothetical protein